MDLGSFKQFYPYTGKAIDTMAWDPATQRRIPFRATVGHKHSTWARTNHSEPELYIQPRSIEEIRLVVNLARECGKQIVTVGSGHSPSDLTCTNSWMVNLDDFGSVVSEDKEKRQLVVQGGMRLYNLTAELEKRGWAMPNLGSITSQSIAGAIATSTHGSSLKHGLISESVVSLTIITGTGKTVVCSEERNPHLFAAALVHLGGLGIITHVTFQAVEAFNLAWNQRVVPLRTVLSSWNTGLWKDAEFVRCWWFPYSDRTIVWHADKTEEPLRQPPTSWYGAGVGRYTYELFLYFARWFPKLTPLVEKYVFYMQYGWKEGPAGSAVQKSHEALTMDCLFSQLVNEWSIPLEKGPEAIERLQNWLTGRPELSGIPISPKGIYVHAPIEVRVTDTTISKRKPWLDQSVTNGPTLYLNATLYRPFKKDLPHWKTYYAAFEYLMKELGGKPHWAKNFVTPTTAEMWDMYPKMGNWVTIREQLDPTQIFVTEWHSRNILGGVEFEKTLQQAPFEIVYEEDEGRDSGKSI